jgi:hypothetical protein
MSHVTDSELEAAMRAAVDESGVDRRVEEATASMTEAQRHAAERNIRAWIAAAESSRKRDSRENSGGV